LASMLSAQVSRHEQELEEIWWISTDVIDTLRQELSVQQKWDNCMPLEAPNKTTATTTKGNTSTPPVLSGVCFDTASITYFSSLSTITKSTTFQILQLWYPRLPEVARKRYPRDRFSIVPSWENFTLDSGATTLCKSRWTRGVRAQDSNYHNRRQCRGESQLIVVPVYVNSMCKWACPIDCAHDQWD
jgi:hypothetical protein